MHFFKRIFCIITRKKYEKPPSTTKTSFLCLALNKRKGSIWLSSRSQGSWASFISWQSLLTCVPLKWKSDPILSHSEPASGSHSQKKLKSLECLQGSVWSAPTPITPPASPPLPCLSQPSLVASLLSCAPEGMLLGCVLAVSLTGSTSAGRLMAYSLTFFRSLFTCRFLS